MGNSISTNQPPLARGASLQATVAYSITAPIFFIPANLLPFMTIEFHGRRNSSTIWQGVKDLMNSGSWPIAAVVFLASLVIPCLKLIILFYLAATPTNENNKTLKSKLLTRPKVI